MSPSLAPSRRADGRPGAVPRAGVALAAASLALAAVAPGSAAAVPAGPYVALGDSYSAGAGVPPFPPGGPLACMRSDQGFGHVVAQRIGAPLAIVDKRREKAGEVAEMTVIGDVSGKTCIIVDDICDTAGTLCKAAQTLIDGGATEVHAYITHGVLSGPAIARVESSVMKSLVITDSIEPSDAVKNARNIRIVPTAPMFAQAILNIWNGTSVSSLFELDTLGPIYEGLYHNE